MNTLLVVSLCLTAAVVARPEDKYSSEYDHVNLDQILHSERLLQNYLNCILDKGKCTPDATALKTSLPEALTTGCAKCTDQQTDHAKTVLKFLSKNKPDVLKEILDKYDPEGVYKSKYQATFEQ
ncbi:allergen Tha p 1 [Aethina tumida]|uniref:allergen Tha p 1 n=1 Tax=Aethina tumida TaxID=116153 RepID=UPI0021489214|nr:allergen Tha p 1 [Aethina tumida]